MAYITKGVRVRYEFFRAYPTCLAGAQMKMGAKMISGEGIVTGVYGDAPVNPTKICFRVQPDGGGDEIDVPEGGIKAIIEEPQPV